MVARIVRDDEVAGSNPAVPTRNHSPLEGESIGGADWWGVPLFFLEGESIGVADWWGC